MLETRQALEAVNAVLAVLGAAVVGGLLVRLALWAAGA